MYLAKHHTDINMADAYLVPNKWLSRIPYAQFGNLATIMPVMKCSGDRTYDFIRGCIVALPEIFGTDTIGDKIESVTYKNMQSSVGIVRSLTDQLKIAIFGPEINSIIRAESRRTATISKSLQYLKSADGEIESLMSQICINYCIVPYICAMISNVTIFTYSNDDMLDMDRLKYEKQLPSVAGFVPAYSSCDHKDLPGMDNLLKILNFTIDIQIPTVKFLMNHLRGLETNTQSPHDFIQNGPIAEIIKHTVNIPDMGCVDEKVVENYNSLCKENRRHGDIIGRRFIISAQYNKRLMWINDFMYVKLMETKIGEL